MCQTKIPLFGRDLFTWLSNFHEPEFFKTGILKIYADNDRQPFADHFLPDQKTGKSPRRKQLWQKSLLFIALSRDSFKGRMS